ncbi:hypothetical protein RYZ18_07200 [Roseovarius sp. 10]|uniref:hypothetical protein n=1 Tax=Roseovarius sp. 10 TaxID=3080563 RepID=UPI002953F2CF|nr:hypothetical protein [Roseovarius sp. 10]MDV7201105.1 hypothetical protein [Roseovarius sp. 10]
MRKSFCQLLIANLLAPLLGHPLHADPVERVLNFYRSECAAIIGDERNIDADLEKIISDPLNIAEDAIYQISLGSPGVTATVVYAGFGCEGYGASWCGSAGCESYVIVAEQIFGPLRGGRPFTTTFTTPYGNEQTLLLVGISGSACGDASGERGISSDPCYMSAVWDQQNQTFRANGDLVVLWD